MTSYSGDGCKTFILYLNWLLKQGSEKFAVSTLLRTVQMFQNNVYPALVMHVLKYANLSNLNSDHEVSKRWIQAIFRGVLSSQYSVKQVDHFSAILLTSLNWNMAGCDMFFNQLEILLENFENFILKVPTRPYSACDTIEPFIIERDFATAYRPIPDDGNNVRFVLCTCPIEGSLNQDGISEIIFLSSKTDLHKFMTFQRLRIKQFVEQCLQKSVNLLLSTEKVPDYALEILSAAKISVIHFVPEEIIMLLQSVFNKQALVDCIDVIEDSNIFEAKFCKSVLFNGKKCVHLCVDSSVCLPRMIIIAAPTPALCSQLVLSLKRCLKSLSLSNARKFTDFHILDAFLRRRTEYPELSERNLFVSIPAGGCFELICYNFLMEFSNSTENSNLAEFCRLLGNALLHVPRTLHKNNCIMGEQQSRDFIKRLTSAQEEGKKCKREDDKSIICLGVDRRGSIKDMSDENVAESLSVKLFTLCSVLQTLQTLIRIDNVVASKRT